MQKHFEINYLSLRVSLISQQQAELPPYLGSTLRGVIGQSLLQTDKDACAFLYRNGEDTVRTGQVVVKPYKISVPFIEYHKQSDAKIYLAKGKTFDIRYRDGSFILS